MTVSQNGGVAKSFTQRYSLVLILAVSVLLIAIFGGVYYTTHSPTLQHADQSSRENPPSPDGTKQNIEDTTHTVN